MDATERMRAHIQRYFPSQEWENAECISRHECPGIWEGDPTRCVGQERSINCDGSWAPGNRYSLGPFQVFESCWDPELNPNSPFTPEQWAQVMDPGVNTWMASRLFGRSGWSPWSAKYTCGVEWVGAAPVPYSEPAGEGYQPAVWLRRLPAASVAGRFGGTPRGVILHGSGGGNYNREAELAATIDVALSSGLGWNATIGDDLVVIHLAPTHWGWNARAASRNYLAVEFVHGHTDDEVSDGQVRAFAWYFLTARQYWPELAMHLPAHSELEANGETGQFGGKVDVFPAGDGRNDQLRSRIVAAFDTLQPGGGPTCPPDCPKLCPPDCDTVPGAGETDVLPTMVAAMMVGLGLWWFTQGGA